MNPVDLSPEQMFYAQVLGTLNRAKLPYLVGGAYAFNCYAGIPRTTRDLDLFFSRTDYPAIAEALTEAGGEVELVFPHWLAKLRQSDIHVDLIFSSGNGIADVDEVWFVHATESEVLDIPVKLLPPEEMIWSKAFVMERERYDGGDIAHLFHARAEDLDWQRLVQRFGPHWRVLFSHLLLFGFIYPGERNRIPTWVIEPMLHRVADEMRHPGPSRLCNGTLLSREQYLGDLEQGYEDARLFPRGRMSEQDIAHWTQAIGKAL